MIISCGGIASIPEKHLPSILPTFHIRGTETGSQNLSYMGINYFIMSNESFPVILVHGWNSHPGIWKPLVSRLSDASIPFWNFDHTRMNGSNISELAIALGTFVGEMRDESGYKGPIDIICHSVGTCIARYLLEVMDWYYKAPECPAVDWSWSAQQWISARRIVSRSNNGFKNYQPAHRCFCSPGI